ncbi:MAG: hypothetical protein AB7F86_09910 [Bdellovibrionales bacterium]
MKTTIYKLVGAGLLASALIGCGQSTGSNSESETSPYYTYNDKMHLDEATLDQITPFVKECGGSQGGGHDNKGKKKKFCVEVCHRPPGNPSKSKNMELPLSATCAHLHHGGKHEDKDYVGPCFGEDMSGDHGSDDDSSSDDHSSDDNSSDDSSSDDTVVETPPGDSSPPVDSEPPVEEEAPPVQGDIPAWCVPVIGLDANCDGIEDATGAPMF